VPIPSRRTLRRAPGRTVVDVPRPLRIQVPGGIYHVTTRGVRQTLIYREDADRDAFLAILGVVVSRRHWICHAYCLMGNHYHLLVETPDPDIAAGMQLLNGFYAQYFNDRHGERGHVFDRRYASELIETEQHLAASCCYIALNPVRAGLCETPAQWDWSSYLPMVGARPTPEFLTVDWVLGLFGHEPERARVAFRSICEESC
jgi:REP-associated tyrosine transposase